jgi:glycosyltransferase involved in cell wall biosynthesis
MKENKKHILIVSQYFYPENFRINDMAIEWVKKGYEVTVLTGIPNYPQGTFYDGFGLFKKRKENYQGVNIIRLPVFSRGSNKTGLMLNYLSFVFSGYIWKLFTRLKPDYVFIYELSPMTQALPAVSFAKKRKIPCYLYVTDLWPESVEVVLGLKNRYALKILNKMVDFIYNRCDKILTSSQSFIEKISSRDESYEAKLMFWPQYAEEFYYKTDTRDDTIYNSYFKGDDSFKILFAGNIGEAQGLGILVDVAKDLKNQNKPVKFYLVGNGRYKDNLIQLISENEVDDYFKFIDSQKPENIKYFMYESDAALICLSKSEIFAMTIPAKTQSCLACGIPVLVSADGEVQDVIKSAKAGLVSDSEDVKGLHDNIVAMLSMSVDELDAMADNAIKCSKDKFDKTKLMRRIDELFR